MKSSLLELLIAAKNGKKVIEVHECENKENTLRINWVNVKPFLAAMSSSRSDDVTNFVCVSVCSPFGKFGDFEVFEARCL